MTGLWSVIGVAGVVAAAVSLIGTAVAVASGPVHPPRDRSSHVDPTPVCGGLGVALGVAAALAAVAWARPGGLQPDAADAVRLAALTGFGAGAVALGALDDLLDLPAWPKFVIIGAASVAMAIVLGPVEALPAGPGAALALAVVPAVLGSALWVFTVVNAVNFMDGANGLVGGAGAIASAGLAVAAAVSGAGAAALAAAVLAGGLAGFLPWNAPRGRVFMGDAGSLLAGVWFAGAALLFVRDAPAGAVYLAPVLAMALLADVLLTLALRARRGQPVFSGHRDHAYQVTLRARGSHLAASARIWRRTALFAVLAVDVAALAPVLREWTPAAALALLALAAAASTVWWLEDRRAGA